MENDCFEEQRVPSGVLKSIIFKVNRGSDTEKLSVLTINAANEVNDPRLGLPNPTSECSTCGSKTLKGCEGHYGCVKFPCGIVHPYFLSEVVKILNKVCPACKSIRQKRVKLTTATSENGVSMECKYCQGSSVFWYPPMKFKVPSSKDVFKKTSIIVEVRDKVPNNARRRPFPPDYWDVIPTDGTPEDSTKPNRRFLSPAQVHHLLQGVDLKLMQKFIPSIESLFLNCFPVTPNCHRITEVCNAFSNRHKVAFDNRTRAYKKLVDFRGSANELGSRVLECLKISKLNPDKLSSTESAFSRKTKNDADFVSSGLKWMKDVILGKRSDHCFRMVVVGNPNLGLNEVGIPCYIAERMQVSENLNAWNHEKLKTCVDLNLLERGKVFVRRRGNLVEIRRTSQLELGDLIFRPLGDGDVVLINRPPSIHQHSLIALYVKVLPVQSCISINPLCCSPLRGDFDGDCLHGFIPQSIEARVELTELVGIDKQLFNEQSGQNLLSFSQDSLLGAHLLLESGVSLDRIQIQQLSMWAPCEIIHPAILKDTPFADRVDSWTWTGKQLFSMLLPRDFNWEHPPNSIHITNGEIISSEGSNWLRDSQEDNLIQKLIEHYQDRALDFLRYAQEMLCEWLAMRGFSVSLSDLYLSADPHSRQNMLEEVSYGLQEADESCSYRQLMIDAYVDFLAAIDDDENEHSIDIEPDRLYHVKQKSAALIQGTVESFRRVFRDIQNLGYKYADRDNSMLSMFRAGSKGNLLKLVQHSMCVGLQHSLVPLSFSFPHQLSCTSWNAHVEKNLDQMHSDAHFPASFIPCTIVRNSFLSGLNPAECFVHSVTNRSSSFSENAEVPGTLHRKLMFFMRDVHASYDGTVRNSYDNQIVEFKYQVSECKSKDKDGDTDVGAGGSPVGSAAACAFSEAAYSALDQPISVLESSPLLNLKNVLECGSQKNRPNQKMTLFLSKKLGQRRHGFEYEALKIQDFLERRFFNDVVSSVQIILLLSHISFTESSFKKNLSPWVCHFHLNKDILKKRGLIVAYIVTSLQKRCRSIKPGPKVNVPFMEISSGHCTDKDKPKDSLCITVSIIEKFNDAPTSLKMVRDIVMPFLLRTVIKGFLEINKVDIFWSERNTGSRYFHNSSGELFLRVSMSSNSDRANLWNLLVDHCIEIMDAIDWTRSRPDNAADFSAIYGVDAGMRHFLNNLESAVSDIGKTILPEHLLLVGNTLSSSGEFVGLNAKGLARQREVASVSSPFVQACFSSPGNCFIKAAKAGAVDNLQGSVDALAWGKFPPLGTGEIFDIVYAKKELEISKPIDIYNFLKNTVPVKKTIKIDPPDSQHKLSEKSFVKYNPINEIGALKGLKKLESMSKSLKRFISLDDVSKLSHTLRNILHKYRINQELGDLDSKILKMALHFHPNGEEKIGSGADKIKVGHHSKHKDSRCFVLVRNDGSFEDFSYRKCVYGALKIIAPLKAQNYGSKWLKHDAPGET